MQYPAEFVSKVKATYPDWEDLHRHLDDGHPIVGRYLDDSRYWTMKPHLVVEMITTGRVEELLAEAQKKVIAGDLYSKWCEISNHQQ